MDYATLIADQQAGLANLLDQLTERERFVLDKHYREGASMKALADQHHVNENRIRQIIRHAVKKCQVKELLLYVADGFTARTKASQSKPHRRNSFIANASVLRKPISTGRK